MSSAPMSPNIQAILDKALNDLTEALLSEAKDAVSKALGGSSAPVRKSKAGKAAKAPKAARANGKRARRSPEDLEALKSKLLSYIKSHPGHGAEQIKAGTGESDIALPIKQLLAKPKRIRTKGVKRATKYFPA